MRATLKTLSPIQMKASQLISILSKLPADSDISIFLNSSEVANEFELTDNHGSGYVLVPISTVAVME